MTFISRSESERIQSAIETSKQIEPFRIHHPRLVHISVQTLNEKKQDLTVCCMSSHLGFLITGAPISPSYWTHTVRELDRGGGGKDSMHVCVFFLYQFSPQNKISNHSSCSTPKYLHLSPTRYLSQSYLFIPASFTCLQPCRHSLILSHSIDEGLLFIQEREKENDRIAVKSAIKIYNFER